LVDGHGGRAEGGPYLVLLSEPLAKS
jgi:hypothetical protein